MYDIIVIGGGIVGLSAAYKIQLHHPELRLLVLEKEDKLSMHQTGRNSGVIHSGIYYKPGSQKAINCNAGRVELYDFCEKYKVPYDKCGKVIVATDASELPRLETIFQRGVENGTEGVRKITAQEVMEIEPFCTSAIAGVHVPCTGIVDYPALVYKLAELVKGINPQSDILTGQKVIAVNRGSESTEIVTEKGKFTGSFAIFCGGLFSDRLATMDKVETEAKIVGFRGDYYDLTEEAMHKIKNLVYPVPNPAFPFLGVHFTRMIHGGVECGPNAVFTFKREGYGKTDFNWQDTREALGYKGTWNLFFKHWRFGLDEYARAFSKRLFLNRLRRLLPDLQMEDIVTGRSGVRAMALGTDGEMIEDFSIERDARSIHVLNAPSPAATAGLSIGEDICRMAEASFGLKL